jgi:hypothetical protein
MVRNTIDSGESTREQSAGQPAQHRGQRKGGDLGTEHIDADDAGRKLIVANRAHGASEPGIGKVPDDIADQRQHADAEGEIGLRTLKQIGPADPRHAVRTVGKPDRVDHHQRDDLLERDRHHREVMPAETKRRHAQHRAGHQRHQASSQQTEPVADLVIRRSNTDSVSTETEERRLRQVDLATETEHDREAEHRDRKRGRLHQDVEDVAVEPHGRGERDERRRADEIRQMTE